MPSDTAEPERLPPPPFWRTQYFENAVTARPDRRAIAPAMILSVLEHPHRTERQPTGRVRHWGWVPELSRWLRVVTLEDGETVHTVFLDRDFEP
ncbi:MAG: hypothetical protein KGJ75_17835 [Alphaproteobacteria bacterium]|nr:hypothetical protein [Alphaproteobacteria bacterium]